MKKWDEFIEWLDKFPKFQERFVYIGKDIPSGDSKTIEAVPFGIEGKDEEEVKQALMQHILERIGKVDDMDIWVRVMPGVQILQGSKEIHGEDRFMGYARIAWYPKALWGESPIKDLLQKQLNGELT